MQGVGRIGIHRTEVSTLRRDRVVDSGRNAPGRARDREDDVRAGGVQRLTPTFVDDQLPGDVSGIMSPVTIGPVRQRRLEVDRRAGVELIGEVAVVVSGG